MRRISCKVYRVCCISLSVYCVCRIFLSLLCLPYFCTVYHVSLVLRAMTVCCVPSTMCPSGLYRVHCAPCTVIRHNDSPQMYLWHQIWRVVHGPEPRFHLRPSRLEMILLAGTRFTYSTAIIIVVIIIDIEIIVIIDTHILILFRLE